MSGLLPLKPDDRDYRLGEAITLPALETLPDEFSLETLPVRHQKDSDFCTQFTYCELSGIQEGVELEPSWSFAMSKIGVDYNEYGADLRDAAKPHVKYGAIEVTESPYSLETKPHTFLRNPEVWSYKLMDLAEKHKKKTYYKVTGQFDHFDNIRASMYARKDAVALGMVWGWDMKQVYIDTIATSGTGHAVAGVGWKGDYLKIKQSYGTEAGENGFQYIHRDVINANVDKYGAFMLTDLDPMIIPENEFQSLIAKLIDLLIRILKKVC